MGKPEPRWKERNATRSGSIPSVSLTGVEGQCEQFPPAQAAADEHRQHRAVAHRAERGWPVRLKAKRGSEQYQPTNSVIAWS